jgi:hypothetical protein
VLAHISGEALEAAGITSFVRAKRILAEKCPKATR